MICRLAAGVTALGLVVQCLVARSADELQVSSVRAVVGSLAPAEGGPSVAEVSPLNAPFGVDFDRDGTMWIVELEGGRIWRRTTSGELSVYAGDGSQGDAGDGGPARQATFNGLHNIAVTKSGQAYLSDAFNHRVRTIDLSTGLIETCAGTGQPGRGLGAARQAGLNQPICVTLAPNERSLLIADINNRRIVRLDLAAGELSAVAGNGDHEIPSDGARALEAPLVDPRAAVEDSQGRVYILERSGHALRRIETDGTIVTVAGTGEAGDNDGLAGTSQLHGPKHLCLDDHDRVFIADDENRTIRCFDPVTQELTTLLGAGFGARQVRLAHPHGVCWDRGALYVADMGNNRVLRVDFEPGR